MLTIEIQGRAIAIVDADEESARDLIADEDFREDLASITSDGEPVWDGSAELTLRPSTSEEEAVAAEAVDEDDVDLEGDLMVVFLIALDDEEDFDED